MKTEIGEYIIGAYLQIVKGCGVVSYNVRPPGGGLIGLGELDVVGLNFETNTAYLCEVTTHLDGLLYGTNERTIEKIKDKFSRQQAYAMNHLKNFRHIEYFFCSPVVPKGYLTSGLEKIENLSLIINNDYSKIIEELREKARKSKNDVGNPFFRTLQILEHLKPI